MSLHIEPSSPDPIYRQIVGQVIRQVAAGHCPPGMRLPSVRDVAATHAINPMTVSKAYARLEAQGVLERQRGRGMVVAETTAVRQTAHDRLATITPVLHELARQAQELGLTSTRKRISICMPQPSGRGVVAAAEPAVLCAHLPNGRAAPSQGGADTVGGRAAAFLGQHSTAAGYPCLKAWACCR